MECIHYKNYPAASMTVQPFPPAQYPSPIQWSSYPHKIRSVRNPASFLLEKAHPPSPFCVRKVLMIGSNGSQILRVGLHANKLLDIAKLDLNNAIIVGHVRKLGIVDGAHQSAGFGGIVCLEFSGRSGIYSHTPYKISAVGLYHAVSLDAIFHQHIAHLGSVDLGHVLAIFLLAQSFLAIRAHGQAEGGGLVCDAGS